MPKEYEHCKESYLKKGISEKRAKAICAGMYYNRHGITVKEAKERGLKSMIYFGRTQNSLKSILLSSGQKVEDFVVFKVSDSLRKNKTLKSLYPKLENPEYEYVAVHKSLLEVSQHGVMLSLDKLLKDVKESEQGELNKDNVAHTEGAYTSVVDGKLEGKSPTEKRTGKLEEEIKYEGVTVKSLSAKEDCHSALEKLQKGEKLSGKEAHMVLGYLQGLAAAGMLTDEEASSLSQKVEEGAELTDEEKAKLKPQATTVETPAPTSAPVEMEVVAVEATPESTEENKPEEEQEEEKAFTATSNTAEALEAEDLEDKVMPLVKSLMQASGAVGDFVFFSKHDAIKFANRYNLEIMPKTGKRAIVKGAGAKHQRLYGSKAKFVVEFE